MIALSRLAVWWPQSMMQTRHARFVNLAHAGGDGSMQPPPLGGCSSKDKQTQLAVIVLSIRETAALYHIKVWKYQKIFSQ
jgi:hypothetical protein